MKLILISLLLLTLLCCSISQKEHEKFAPVRISVDLNKTKADIGEVFSDFSFIRLETNEESIFNRVSYVEKNDSLIILFDNYDNTLLSFNSKGKFLANYIKKGKGPGETSSVTSYFYDIEQNRIVISSWDKQKLLYFSTGGEFIKAEPLNIFNEGMIRISDSSIAYYTGKPVNIIENRPNSSFLIVTNNEGQFLYSACNSPVIKNSGFILFQSLFKFQDQTLFKYPYSDTIFSVNSEYCEPKYIIDFGADRIKWDEIDVSNPKRIHFQILGKKMASIEHYFFELKDKIFFGARRDMETFYICYDKHSETSYVYDIKNLINSKFGLFGKIVGATSNEIICLIEPIDLLFPDDSQSTVTLLDLDPKILDLTNSLSVNDNPILLFFKVK